MRSEDNYRRGVTALMVALSPLTLPLFFLGGYSFGYLFAEAVKAVFQ